MASNGDGSDDAAKRAASGGGAARRCTAIPSDLYQQLRPDDAGGNIAPRPTYTELQLEEAYDAKMSAEEQKSRKQDLMQQRKVGKEKKDSKTVALGIVTRVLPCVKVFLTYKPKEYFIYDLLSGISVGLFAIPQAIAFSLLASLPPQYGFYSAFFAMTIYFIFGTSRHLNMTHQGAVSLLVGESVRAGVEEVFAGRICNATEEIATVAPNISAALGAFAIDAPVDCVTLVEASVQVSITLTMIAGILQLVMGLLQFGFLTIYLSDPLNSAFTCGAALHILSSQLANMLGTTIPPISDYGKFFLYFVEAVKRIAANDVNGSTILVFVVSFLALLAVKLINEKCSKYVKIPIPIDVIVLVSTLLLSRFLNWSEAGVDIVGEIPSGFVPPRAPGGSLFSGGIITNGLVLGVISYSLSVSVAKTFALRHGYEVDANQELVAYGASNFIMSWFSTFTTASSIACTSLHESMSGKTLVYSVYAVVITLIGILFVAPVFEHVPKCVLSGIILVNLKNMMLQAEQLPGLWRTNKYDFAIWIATLGAILGLDLPMGLLFGVVFSLATVIFRSQAPKAYLLGRVRKTDIYRNIKKNKAAEEIPGVKIFKFDGSLYFASADNFRTRLYRQVAMNPKKILAKAQAHAKREGRMDETDIRTDVLDAEQIKEVLETVQSEGQMMDAAEREKVQAVARENRSFDRGSADWTDDDDDDDNEEPTVNVFCIILDLGACAFTDAVGIRLLKQIVDDFKKIGVEIYVCGCSSLVRSQLRKGEFFKKRDEKGVFVTVHDAVLYALSTFYNELVEDEAESSIDVGAASNHMQFTGPPADRRGSATSSSSSSDVDARELRRQTRKTSRHQRPSSHRKPSERLRGSVPRDEIREQPEQPEQPEQRTLPAKNRYEPDETPAKPLAVFDDGASAADDDEEEAEARLQSLPDEESHDYENAAFEQETEM